MGDCAIVHPGAVCVMVRLLPKLYKEGHSQVSLNISKCYLNNVCYFSCSFISKNCLLFADVEVLKFT